MRTALVIAVPGGMFATFVMWWLGEHLSPDAIAMAIGLAFGVLAGLPAAALVLLARRRDDDDDAATDDYIDVQPTYSDQVTPYSQLARRVMQLPELPDRRAEIDQLRAVLDYIEAREVSR